MFSNTCIVNRYVVTDDTLLIIVEPHTVVILNGERRPEKPGATISAPRGACVEVEKNFRSGDLNPEERAYANRIWREHYARGRLHPDLAEQYLGEDPNPPAPYERRPEHYVVPLNRLEELAREMRKLRMGLTLRFLSDATKFGIQDLDPTWVQALVEPDLTAAASFKALERANVVLHDLRMCLKPDWRPGSPRWQDENAEAWEAEPDYLPSALELLQDARKAGFDDAKVYGVFGDFVAKVYGESGRKTFVSASVLWGA